MTIGKRFVDSMDRDRSLNPVGLTKDGKRYMCKVFWRTSKIIDTTEGKAVQSHWHFGGYAEAPKNLFFERMGDRLGSIGFVMMSDDSKPVLIQQERRFDDREDRYGKRRDRDDRDDFRSERY
jgi:hypothetical protein